MSVTWRGICLFSTLFALGPAAAADKRVCIEVQTIEPAEPSTPSAPAAVQEEDASQIEGEKQREDAIQKDATVQKAIDQRFIPLLPIGQTPVLYLQRLFEYFVTHEPGFQAVREGCEERLRVELYPLEEGWTAFARYSATGREERVDQLFPDELSQFAERASLALLYDQPIDTTILRDTVLRADSKRSQQRVRGTHHFTLGLGTQVRGGTFNTVQQDGSADEGIRVFSPMGLSAGYRGKFESWGIEALAGLGIGTSQTAVADNPEGGHIDFGGDFGLALHFLHYFDPRGIHSFYLGAGGTFELLWFSGILPEGQRQSDNRTTLVSGGLDVDLLLGWEFMRASTVQFFLQAELNLPAYAVETEDDYANVHTWFPGLGVKLGVMF